MLLMIDRERAWPDTTEWRHTNSRTKLRGSGQSLVWSKLLSWYEPRATHQVARSIDFKYTCQPSSRLLFVRHCLSPCALEAQRSIDIVFRTTSRVYTHTPPSLPAFTYLSASILLYPRSIWWRIPQPTTRRPTMSIHRSVRHGWKQPLSFTWHW